MGTPDRKTLAEIVGRRLEKLRKSQGFSTAAEFADFIGIRPHALWRYENGQVLPGADVLRRIAEKCGVSVDSLVGHEPQAKANP